MRPAVFALSLFCAQATAQVTEQTLTRQSAATVSAFTCVTLAPTAKEADRLMQIGLKNGRDFIEAAQANPEVYRKASEHVAILWRWVTRGTPDFMLGQVYWMMAEDTSKRLGTDQKVAANLRSVEYNSKNCRLISE